MLMRFVTHANLGNCAEGLTRGVSVACVEGDKFNKENIRNVCVWAAMSLRR